MTPRLVAAISNISMSLGHDGLALCARKFSIRIDQLGDNELVLFINKGRDKLKVLGAKGVVLGYVKMAKGRKLPLEAVQFIPATFSGKGQIDVDAAIGTYLEKALLAKKGTNNLGVAWAVH